MIGFRDDIEKLSSNLIGRFQISRAHLKISRILLATKKILLSEIIQLFSSLWNFDAVRTPVLFSLYFLLVLMVLTIILQQFE